MSRARRNGVHRTLLYVDYISLMGVAQLKEAMSEGEDEEDDDNEP